MTESSKYDLFPNCVTFFSVHKHCKTGKNYKTDVTTTQK